MKQYLKEDLAVKEKQSVSLNPALRRVHTARHSLRSIAQEIINTEAQTRGEKS